jgi:AraC family transcriptional regulator of arabinose operon
MIIAAGHSDQPPGTVFERRPGFPYWSAGFWISGKTRMAFSHRVFLMGEATCLLIPPFTPYTGTVQHHESETWVLFEPRPNLAAALPNPLETKRISFLRFPEQSTWKLLLHNLQELLRWWNALPPQIPLAENALEKLLLLSLWTRDPLQQTSQDERIERATEYIRDHLQEPISINDLAKVAALSPSRLAHLFRERMSLTPMQFLELRRIERARQLLLTTNLQIKEIALRSGFSSPEHFSVRFRKATSQSPLAFRQKPKRRHGEILPRELW